MTNESGKKPAMHKKHVARLERELQQPASSFTPSSASWAWSLSCSSTAGSM
ncbi:MAG TPA: hypothetical protein PKJ84_11425 [Anaerolineales bacterium]|nr:hypothetical protein [Anaerolineales bacterium]